MLRKTLYLISLVGFTRYVAGLARQHSTEMSTLALQRNGTSWSDGEIEMRTGEGNIDSLGQIVSWNKRTSTDAYEGECSRLRGSTDGLFPPGLADITDSISFYSTDLCRPLHFTKSGSNSIHGIPVRTFELDPDNFANSSVCPSNACYNNNIPSGVQVQPGTASHLSSQPLSHIERDSL